MITLIVESFVMTRLCCWGCWPVGCASRSTVTGGFVDSTRGFAGVVVDGAGVLVTSGGGRLGGVWLSVAPVADGAVEDVPAGVADGFGRAGVTG